MRLITQPFGSGFNEPVQDDIRRITVHATLTGQTASDNHPTKKNGLFTGLLMDCIAQYRCEIPFPQVFTDVINRLPHQAPQLNTEMPPFKLVCEQ